MKDLAEPAPSPGSASLAALKHPCSSSGPKSSGPPTILFSSSAPSQVLEPAEATPVVISESRNGRSAERRRSVGVVDNGKVVTAAADGLDPAAVESDLCVIEGGEEEDSDSLGALIKRSSDETNGGGGCSRIDTLGRSSD